jgi:hypothetical protein
MLMDALKKRGGKRFDSKVYLFIMLEHQNDD